MDLFFWFVLTFIGFFILFNFATLFTFFCMNYGQRKIEKGEYESGLKFMKTPLIFKKVKPFTKLRYAFNELKFGDLELSRKVIFDLLNDPKIDENIKYEAKAVYAMIEYLSGKYEDALFIITEVYNEYKTTNVYCTMGYLYNILKSPKEAIEFNLEAIEYNSEHLVLLDNLGQSYYLNGEYDKSIDIYEKLIDKKPTFPEAYFNYALTLISINETQDAYDMLKRASTCNFNNLSTITKIQVEEKITDLSNNLGANG